MLTAPLSAIEQESCPQPSPSINCWLLHLTSGHVIAISIHQVTELLRDIVRLPVPRAPEHCNNLIAWRERLIPLVDYQHPNRSKTSLSHSQVMVIRFANDEHGIDYLGFSIKHIEKATIHDSDFLIPDDWQDLPFTESILSSCEVNDQCIYILDMKTLYNQH
ncbi:hypothetical protein A9Q99_17815 [Gammaproteobacteria bacterium 45_16_T64]|nr:hypothetical protein A9Q99_17815 [Gammaproteobacteria bacterium 45_16_T64]